MTESFGSPETAVVADRIRDLLKEVHTLANSLPQITVDGIEQGPIALLAIMDVYDAERPDERATQTAICARGFQLSRILVQQIVNLPKGAQRDIIMRVMQETMAAQAAVAEN
jgi:hypothetical protein